jgi:hypothetical protein
MTANLPVSEVFLPKQFVMMILFSCGLYEIENVYETFKGAYMYYLITVLLCLHKIKCLCLGCAQSFPMGFTFRELMHQ